MHVPFDAARTVRFLALGALLACGSRAAAGAAAEDGGSTNLDPSVGPASDAATTPPQDASPTPSGDAGAGTTVVIAAAGDISDTTLTSQTATSDLVLAGHYDAVLTLGDNQYNTGSDDDLVKFFGPSWGRFKATIFPAPGNHEYGTNAPVPAGGYFDYFFNTQPTNPRIASLGDSGAADPTRGYYSFDLGAWHIIALNSNTAATEDEACGVIPCGAGSAQEQWLRADLQAHQNTACVLAYWHHARFTAGPHTDNTDLSAIWDDLYQFNADIVLNGHDHNYQRFSPMAPDGGADPQHGIVEFIVGTGGTHIAGATKANPPSTLAASENVTENTGLGFGVLQLTLRATGYDYKFVSVAGTTFTDEGSGQCH